MYIAIIIKKILYALYKNYSEKIHGFKVFIKILVSVSALSLSGNQFHTIGVADA